MLIQTPATGEYLLKWQGDVLVIELAGAPKGNGRAVFRSDLCGKWTDYPMTRGGDGVFRAEVKLERVGVFSGKACWFGPRCPIAEWPEGGNLRIKVQSAAIKRGNSIYTVFPRQFGSFREVVRRLPVIMDTMGFRIIQTLPPFPVPTTYAVMGEYGCPFAATDFRSVDPAMAEFDTRATPLDQFRELIDAVHARRGLFFIDLPANHTGWASVLQSEHPDWFVHDDEGRFVSPGAWGVTWADLVQLDYTKRELWSYMADVFRLWCSRGVDGFRCDAGYMIPAAAWEHIVSRVRAEYPDTVFMLEGLGGDLAITDRLLSVSGLDWAYSEVFQTCDRGAFEWYLPKAIERAERYGALIHFAETHDNDRLAKGGETYARLRVGLAALLSWQGGWGIANGVEWFATEKIDVHGKNDLNWGSASNMVDLIAKLNFILATDEDFIGVSHLELITRGDGNTLAVMRNSRVLVLANLDCVNPVEADYDRVKFPLAEAIDLLSERRIPLADKVHLAPGEVLCLKGRSARCEAVRTTVLAKDASFHFVYPRDLAREVVVASGESLAISSASPFRASLVSTANGRCLACARSDGANRAVLHLPDYRGEGDHCETCTLELSVYSGDRAVRTRSTVKIAPPSEKARIVTRVTGPALAARAGDRVILSNGAGAMSQLRIGWGGIESQYDAILAANPNPTCPSDRLVVWTRARMWLQCEGVVSEFTGEHIVDFRTDTAGNRAEWVFRMPCGVGRFASFAVTVVLKRGANVARLSVKRAGGGDDCDGAVRVVVRPDIEWRSFHSATKAYAGVEMLFPKAVKPRSDGFSFSPYAGAFDLSVSGGEYHHACEWAYNIRHEEEARRGQEGAGDLFSPGWISADLEAGREVVLTGVFGKPDEGEWPADAEWKDATFETQLREAMKLFIVRRDDLKTVIAGYPWFLDWGRDTFIFMRGMIAAGMHDDALRILKAFAAFEENGTLPNIIYGDKAGNRDTTDAQLWFIRCVKELVEKLKVEKLKGSHSTLIRTCESIVENYIKGTPNGISVDPASALVWSPSHFTWMDTNYPACTPREGYPVEIQALWISALEFLGRDEMAAKAKESVVKYFRSEHGYADCLDAAKGVGAADAVADRAIRPNQLFLVSLGILDDVSILEATEELLVPGGIRSLSPSDPRYRGRYEGDEDSSRKPAYHNGTVWAWPFPQYAEAAARLGRLSVAAARSLLASAVDNINAGAIGQMSEIADGDAPHDQKGCCAQAWSVSEVLRVWIALSRCSEK